MLHITHTHRHTDTDTDTDTDIDTDTDTDTHTHRHTHKHTHTSTHRHSQSQRPRWSRCHPHSSAAHKCCGCPICVCVCVCAYVCMRRVNVAVVPTVCVRARGRTWVRRWVRVRMIHVWHDMREVHTRLPLEATLVASNGRRVWTSWPYTDLYTYIHIPVYILAAWHLDNLAQYSL
jgi:hypothetical protein